MVKKIERLNFPFKETDLLGDVSPIIAGKITKCGTMLSVHEIPNYKSYVNDVKDLEKPCFLVNEKNKNQAIYISSQSNLWETNIEVARVALSSKAFRDSSDKLMKIWNDLNSTQKIFEQEMILLTEIKEHGNIFNLGNNVFISSAMMAVPFNLTIPGGLIEHQKIGGINLLKIKPKNKDHSYLLITEDNKVYAIDFLGFDDTSKRFIKSYLKSLLAKGAIVLDEAAAKKVDEEFNKELNQMKEEFERTGKISGKKITD